MSDQEHNKPVRPYHPIVPFDADGNTFESCISIINKAIQFTELLSYIVVDDEDQRFIREGGLSPGAASAYRQLVRLIVDSAKFAADSLKFNHQPKNSEDQPIRKRKQSPH